MKIETLPQDNCTLTLTVEVDDERIQPALRSAARRIAKQVHIPGFRPGKAPYETIVRHVGEGAIYSEALEDLGQKVYQEALEQENIDAFAPGELEDVQLKPMVLKFTVPLRPEIDLGDYRNNLRVPYTAPEVTDESVQETLDNLRERQAELEPVQRPAQMGDVVTLDAKGYLHEGENPSDFLLADENISLLLDEKTDWPMPGFAPQLVGMQAGDERQFDMTFPEDYPNESLRGEVAHFTVKCQEVKERKLPEWSDELAKSLGDYESLEALRAEIRSQLERQAERGTRREYADKVVSQLVEQAQVKYPPVLLEQELDEYMDDLDQRLREQRLTLDDYLKIEGKTREQFREEIRPQAEGRLKRTLVLGKVVDLENLRVSDEDVSGEIDRLSTAWGDRAGEVRQALAGDRARRMVSLDLLADKAVDRLVAIAKGETVPEPEAEAATEAQPEGQAPAQPEGQAGAPAEGEGAAAEQAAPQEAADSQDAAGSEEARAEAAS